MKKLHLFITLTVISHLAFSQVDYTLINSKYEIDEQQKALEADFFHTNVKPYNKKDFPVKVSMADDIFNGLDFEIDENGNFKKKKKKFVELGIIAGLGAGYDIEQKQIPFDSYLGMEVHSNPLRKITLHAEVYGGYSKMPAFLSQKTDSLGIVPQNGLAFLAQNGQYAFFNANWYASFRPKKYLNFEFGRGKHFLGDGYRSLQLSDNSNFAPYFKTDVEVWKIRYVYLINGLKDYDQRFPEKELYRKYTFTHYLSINATKWLNFNLFETVISSPIDSMGANRGIDFNYLNPAIFFRPVDLSQGSPDNVLVGAGGSIKILKATQFYGHAILDEFIYSHFRSQDGWWGNKYGLQAGYKSFNTLFIKNLYSQAEVNFVRPFTYSHSDPITAYGNFKQPLAHPLGANFREAIGILAYRYKDFGIQAKVAFNQYGANADTINYGNHIYRPYTDRILGDTGYQLTTGLKVETIYGELSFWYPVYKKMLFAEATIAYRRQTWESTQNESLFFSLGLKTPITNMYYDY